MILIENAKENFKVSKSFPKEKFIYILKVPTNRPKWKFWLPDFLYNYIPSTTQ